MKKNGYISDEKADTLKNLAIELSRYKSLMKPQDWVLILE
jgi:hypothetical protein